MSFSKKTKSLAVAFMAAASLSGCATYYVASSTSVTVIAPAEVTKVTYAEDVPGTPEWYQKHPNSEATVTPLAPQEPLVVKDLKETLPPVPAKTVTTPEKKASKKCGAAPCQPVAKKSTKCRRI